MFNKVTLILLCLVVCLLGGCAANVTPQPLPTETNEVRPTLHATTQPTVTPVNTPTIAATATAVAVTTTPLPELELIDSLTSVSPDGKWTTSISQRPVSQSDIQQVFIVASTTDTTVKWIAEDTLQPDGLAYHWPIPLYWSTKHPFLYFSHQYSGDGCFTAQNFRGSDLWRTNLDTGEVEQLSPKVGYWLVISPDERTLAYMAYSQGGLVLRDLESGNERQTGFDIDTQYAGETVYKSNLIWAPDSSSLLVTAEIGACSGNSMYSIIKIDVPTLSQTTLINESSRNLKTVTWTEAERAELLDDSGNEWWLYTNSSEVISK